jgi:hypothetical protein
LQKASKVEDLEAQVQAKQASEELNETQRLLFDKGYNLYQAVSRLELETFRKDYDDLRQDPKWYVRHEMVKDYSDRGGCCSRSCDCCARRPQAMNKGNRSIGHGHGHCTVECSCCIDNRGLELSKKNLKRGFRMMTQDLSSLLPMLFS